MLKFAKFIGANTDFSTAQAYLFPRVFPEDSTDPVFGLVISGEGDDVFIYLRQRILNLEEKFLAPFERVTDKLHQLSQDLQTELSSVNNLKFTLFCAKESVFYVLEHGNNIVEILRNGKSTPVISGVDLQEKVISGFLQPGDRIVILTVRPGENHWSKEIIDQVLSLPIAAIDDAEVIFASSEQKTDHPDLLGVRNIEPVAFILVEDTTKLSNQTQEASGFGKLPINLVKKPKIDFKLPALNIWLFLHSKSRRLFGAIRQIPPRLLVVLGIILLIMLLSGGGWLYLQNRDNQKNQRVSNLILLIENNLSQAQSLKDSDSKTAAEQISQAKNRVTELTGIDAKNPRIKDIKNKVEQAESEVLKIYKDFDLQLFLSPDLIKENFQTKRMSFSVGKILLLDTNSRSLISIDTKTKTPDIIAGPQQLGDPKFASINGSDAFVYSLDKGLIHIDLDTNKLLIISSPDPEWGKIIDIFGFSSNLYVLDDGRPPQGGMIWKYSPIESGYSSKIKYLKSQTNLSAAKRLVIDYSVWVLTGEPDILKFTAGNSDFYGISGLSQPLGQIDGLSVPEDLDSVFILDKLNSRILVTKKNGEYLAQYIKPELAKVDDLFIDEDQKLIYLLIENKIYTTTLR